MDSRSPIKTRSGRPRGVIGGRGFTLTELLIALTMLAIVSTAVISAYLFMARNLERMMNSQKQSVASRRTLQQFSADLGAAIAFTTATSTDLVFTVPISGSLTSCAITNGSKTVTCTSTSTLSAGLTISGSGIPESAKVASITNSTTFVLNSAATATSSGLTLSVIGRTTTVEYHYNSGSSPATLTRVAGGVTTTLLGRIDTTATTPTNGFAFYDADGNAVAGTSPFIRSVEFAFTTLEGRRSSGTRASYVVVSPRLVLRNKPMLQ